MFQVLEGRRKRRVITPTTLIASVAVHVLLLGGVVFAASTGPDTVEVVGPEFEVLPPVPVEPKLDKADPPPPPPVEDPEPRVDEPKVGTNVVIRPPVDVPDVLPPPNPNDVPVDPAHSSGIGDDADVFGDPTDDDRPLTGDPTPAPVEPYIPGEGEVEERPSLDRNGLARVLERYYPRVLADARVTGRVVLEVIVDENGRVREGSARVIEASHPAFGDAALRAAERFRFRPGRMAGVPVPVRVTIPISWTVAH